MCIWCTCGQLVTSLVALVPVVHPFDWLAFNFTGSQFESRHWLGTEFKRLLAGRCPYGVEQTSRQTNRQTSSECWKAGCRVLAVEFWLEEPHSLIQPIRWTITIYSHTRLTRNGGDGIMAAQAIPFKLRSIRKSRMRTACVPHNAVEHKRPSADVCKVRQDMRFC